MTEHPILFAAPMVRAILDGKKTQTRRLLTVPWARGVRVQPYEPYYVEEDGQLLVDCANDPDSRGGSDYREASTCLRCPFGRPGDRLWVRETWAAHWMYDDVPPLQACCPSDRRGDNYWYRANPENHAGSRGCPAGGCRGVWRPSIHMPRWASRILLEVTEVRAQRLQEIAAEEAVAEGTRCWVCDGRVDGLSENDCECFHTARTAVRSFSALWDSVSGEGAKWSDNPWVWCVSFKRADGVKP